MALRLSTGLRQYLLGGDCIRKAFEDALMNIYSGSAPATADLPSTGGLLARITLAGAACTHDAISTIMVDALEIDDATQGQLNGCTINTDYVYSHTNAGSESVTTVALALAKLMNLDPLCPIYAWPLIGHIYCFSKFAGEAITIVPTGNGTPVLSHITANARINSLHLAAPVAGAISKESAVWSGEILITGTAGYFRFVRTNDDDDNSAVPLRLQGSISTSGSELNLSNLNLVDGATLTIDVFSLTEPAA